MRSIRPSRSGVPSTGGESGVDGYTRARIVNTAPAL